MIDGFPRELEQALVFEQQIQELGLIIQFECSEETILGRLIGRMESTPVHLRRSDDKPEVIKDRVKTYFEVSKKATDFYLKLGKVREVSAIGTPNEVKNSETIFFHIFQFFSVFRFFDFLEFFVNFWKVFERTRDALKPNIYAIIGATCMGKTTLAKRLAIHTHYNYIEAETFFKANGATTCEEKVKILGEFTNASPNKNFVLDGFPQTKKQAKIFIDTFVNPLKTFNIKAEKDEVYNRIDQTFDMTSPHNQASKDRFDQYLTNKDEIEEYLKDNQNYQILNGLQTSDQQFQAILGAINPHLLVAINAENQELATSVLAKLEGEQGYINLDYNQLVEDERRRGLHLHAGTELSQARFLSLFRRVIYGQAKQNRKYLLSNVPNDFNLIKELNDNICKFQKLLYFTNSDAGNPENQMTSFDKAWSDIIGYYHSRNILVPIGVDDVDLVNFNIERRTRYGLVVGPLGVGKTKIARQLKKREIVKLYRLEKYKNHLAKRLSTDDEPVDEVSTPDALKHLKADLLKCPLEQINLLDDFPFTDGGFQAIIEALGQPLFILRLQATDETVLARYKKKNDMGPEDELSEADQEILDGYKNVNDEVNTIVNEMVASSQTLTVYDIDVNVPELSTIEAVLKLFQKRIILTRNINPEFHEEVIRNRLGFLSARHKYQFIPIEDVYAELDPTDPVQVRDPHYIVSIIKRIANSNATFSR